LCFFLPMIHCWVIMGAVCAEANPVRGPVL
jgi:hypothetical protein